MGGGRRQGDVGGNGKGRAFAQAFDADEQPGVTLDRHRATADAAGEGVLGFFIRGVRAVLQRIAIAGRGAVRLFRGGRFGALAEAGAEREGRAG